MPALKQSAVLILVFAWSAILAPHGNAQDDSSEFQLPADPAAWLNSPPITLDVLKGKAAVMYFYEES